MYLYIFPVFVVPSELRPYDGSTPISELPPNAFIFTDSEANSKLSHKREHNFKADAILAFSSGVYEV
jgi:hypothetical protein